MNPRLLREIHLRVYRDWSQTHYRTDIDILRVGTSAGGARAKAILAWHPKTKEFRSGQVDAGKGFEHWLMKFDGITSSHGTEISTPKGYGKIE